MKCIAFYLPQYYPTQINDHWWGKGFTEWRNVTKAKPLFYGHQQPKYPADLGYYDLRVSETRDQQSQLAKKNGITAFCYWHYWFGGGVKTLERPIQEVIASRSPDIQLCLAWANESWRGHWHGLDKGTIIEQTYPGKRDIRNHFEYLLPIFTDDRYLRIDDRPLFIIYKPMDVPNLNSYINTLRNMAINAGFKDLFIAGYFESAIPTANMSQLDAFIYSGFGNARKASLSFKHRLGRARQLNKFLNIFDGRPVNIFDYDDAAREWEKIPHTDRPVFPVAFPNWDNSPRSQKTSTIVKNSTPEKFERHLNNLMCDLSKTKHKEKYLFIKSWNEWAEGNYLEPDTNYGMKYLEAVRKSIEAYK